MDWIEGLRALRTATPEAEIVLRLLMSAAAGAVIGLDREFKDRPAGLRTHMLTALAAAVFTLLTFEIYETSKSTADPIRIVEAVTAGVAFLGAGAIIQSRGNVQGLTTGAAMWMAGALGVACGAGYYTLAILATLLTVTILALLARLTLHRNAPAGTATAGGRDEAGSASTGKHAGERHHEGSLKSEP